jgi:hypothetical protein
MKNRISRTLSTVALLAGSITGTFAATSAPAQAASCSYSAREATVSVYTVATHTYLGYVELLYAANCYRVEAHFHVDASFSRNHYGWNIGLETWNDKSKPNQLSELDWNNSSASDFYGPSVSIYGYPDENFGVLIDWSYDACPTMTMSSNWHNFSNGQEVPMGFGDSTPGC